MSMSSGGSAETRPVVVTHSLGSYPVYVEPGVLARLGELVARHVPGRRLALLTDSTVRALPSKWRLSLPGVDAELVIPPGERSKTRARWTALSDALLDRTFGRDSALLLLGGGVVGDLGGFVAATYLRGIPYIQIPTTLLAMLDASVGGKTAVDTPHGKNLIGAFHPPAAVVADPAALATLPEREFRGGLAEAVKHGVVADPAYFEWIEREADALLRRDTAALEQLVRRSVEIKAEVVSADEREGGRRAILNAGHTVAHALERASAYRLPHGEAVALGLVAEAALAEELGVALPGLRERIAAVLARLGLPVRLTPPLPPETIVPAMASDKKNRAGTIRFALPSAVGAIGSGREWTVAAPASAIRKALASIL
jgi:3-dehydroquinate synthase